MAKKTYTWFIYALNSHTNAVLARELPAENIWRGAYCTDGVIRDLWQSPKETIKRLWESREDLDIDIQVFNVCGPSKKIQGRVRECTFLFKKNRVLTKSANSV